jgi:mitochondrial distribution and morphology protein 10
MGTRFNFNMYSYESEWTMGLEWWLRRSRQTRDGALGTLEEPDDSSILLNPISPNNEVQGVVKVRASTNNVSCSLQFMHFFFFIRNQDVALMWEGRLKNLLVSLGVSTDLSSKFKPIRSVGLEVAYFSSGD